MKKAITIEVYIRFLDKTWSTIYIKIPAQSRKTINELIDEYCHESISNKNIAFWGLYNITNTEDDNK